MKTLRIGFMGTPDFAVPALDALCTSHHDVVCVYTQPPRRKGRGQQVQPSPVHEYAGDHGIPVFTPVNFKTDEARAAFMAQELDVAVVAAYGLILPEIILKAPKYGCINIHASLLPRWRGASPIQQAIRAGDEETGISIMQMNKGLDTGPVIRTRTVHIRPTTTASSLHDQLAALGGAMIEDVMDDLAEDGHLESEVQDDALAVYAPLLKKRDGRIDWSQSAADIDRQVRGFNPWPGVWADLEDKTFKVTEASPADEKTDKKTGTILTRDGHVACGGGTVLQILKIQPPGKKPMDFASAVNGGYCKTGGAFS